MKFLRSLIVFILLVIIVGGIGYLGYNIYLGNLSFGNMNMSSGNNNMTGNSNTGNANSMAGMGDESNTTGNSGSDNSTDGSDNNSTNNQLPNTDYAKNQEKLSKAIDEINAAMNLITIDPYSNITVGSADSTMQMNNGQGLGAQTNGTINIYPSDNSSVNISPGTDTSPQAAAGNIGNTANQSQNSMGGMGNTDTTAQNVNKVFDQTKLQQLHYGIYTIAQGMQSINDLNAVLTNEAAALEDDPITFQIYVQRYNIAAKNKMQLENSIKKLSQASVLINVNPYSSDSGYSYDDTYMSQLHQGIYKLAQGMALLDSLSNDFTNQMSAAYTGAANLTANNSGQMDMSGMQTGLFSNFNVKTIFSIIIIILVIGLFIGVIGAMSSIFKTKPDVNKQ